MQRINVKGGSASGKTTLARAVAGRLGLPYLELDALNHGPNWTEASAAELQDGVRGFMGAATDGWVIDGNYEHKLDTLVVNAADTVVWLDLPLLAKLQRLLRRTRGRIRGNVKLWNDNVETWRNVLWGRESLFVWSIRSHFRHRRQWPRQLGPDVVRLRSEAEIREWLARLP